MKSLVSRVFSTSITVALFCLYAGCSSPDSTHGSRLETTADTLRVMTFNLEDVRSADLRFSDNQRLISAAVTIQHLHPDILLLNEIAFDDAFGPSGGVSNSGNPYPTGGGLHGQMFADSFIAVQHTQDLAPLTYRAFMAPSNTGLASGFDLDHDGHAVLEYPEPPAAAEDGTPAVQTNEGRAYGNDSWGFGTFPGQYAMALLVRDGLELDTENIRTFQTFKWKDLDDPRPPVNPETGDPWYSPSIWTQFPLSSKSHWDIPVRLQSGRIVHILASHPTPPAFDGPEMRNRLRNRAEIKFWGDYISGVDVLDDQLRLLSLSEDAPFIILGDLNADPDEGSAIDDPVGTFLLSNPRVNASFTPLADDPTLYVYRSLDADDTAAWGMRVDYVLPSVDFDIIGGAIIRMRKSGFRPVSDHFPVYLDLVLD